MVIDSEKVKRKAKPNLFSRPQMRIGVGRNLPPSKMRKRAEIFKLIFGAILFVAFVSGCAILAWTLVSQGTEYAKIRAEQEAEKERMNEVAPVSIPITYNPSK